MQDKIDMVPEEWGDTDSKQNRHQEHEDDMILGGSDSQGVRPEPDEVLDGGARDVNTVG